MSNHYVTTLLISPFLWEKTKDTTLYISFEILKSLAVVLGLRYDKSKNVLIILEIRITQNALKWGQLVDDKNVNKLSSLLFIIIIVLSSFMC